jgi:hypothetical protein
MDVNRRILLAIAQIALCAGPVVAAPLGDKLIQAVRKGNPQKVRILLEKGADPNAADQWRACALFFALERLTEGDFATSSRKIKESSEIIDILLGKGARVDCLYSGNWAVLAGKSIDLLLAGCSRAAAQGGDCSAPLPLMARFGLTDQARELLASKGAVDAVDAVDDNGFTALVVASGRGDDTMVKMLLDHGADVNRTVQYKGTGQVVATALASSAERQDRQLAKILIEKGANIEQALEAANYQRQTASSSARVERWKEAVEFLEKLSQGEGVSGGVSRDELTKLVKAAVAGASQAEQKAAQRLESAVDRPTYKLASRPQGYAVVVGVEKYADLPEARFAERDARAVRAHLVALGYPERNIVSLLGHRASKAGFEKTFGVWLPQNVGPESEVFVYYSGHGAPDPGTGQAFLLPYDGDPQYLGSTAYPVKKLYAALGSLKAKRKIVALDACFSGAGGRSVLPKGTRPLVMKIDTGQVFGSALISLSASQSDQISGSVEEQGHGLFTYYLLKGLNGDAKDEAGAVTLKSLHDYVVPHVQDEAQRNNRKQTPQFSQLDTGYRFR